MSKIILTEPGDPNITIAKLKFLLFQYSREELWFYISRHSSYLNSKAKLSNGYINVETLNTIIYLTLSLPPISIKFKKLNDKRFIELNRKAAALGNILEVYEGSNQFERTFLSIANTQFPYHEVYIKQKVVNYWLLFSGESPITNNLRANVDEYLNYRFSVSFDKWSILITYLFSCFFEEGAKKFDGQSKYFKSEKDWVSVRKILDEYSKSYFEFFKLTLLKKYSSATPIYKSYNPIRDYPIIRVRGLKYFCPAPQLLQSKHYEGVFHEISEYYAELERKKNPNKNPYDNEFSHKYGKVLEELVNYYSLKCSERMGVLPEFSFRNGKKEKRSADCHFYHKRVLTLVQVKAKRIVQRSFNGDPESFWKDFRGAVIRPIEQTKSLIEDSRYMSILKEKLRITQLQSIILLNVVPTELYVDFLDKYQEEISELRMEIGKIAPVGESEIFIVSMSISAFSLLMDLCYSTRLNIIDPIRKYEVYRKDPQKLFRDYSLDVFPTFDEFLRLFCRDKVEVTKINDELFDEVYNRWLNELKEIYAFQ